MKMVRRVWGRINKIEELSTATYYYLLYYPLLSTNY